MDVPHFPVYDVLLELEQEVTSKSSLDWQPGAAMSGLRRPSSVGPQLVKLVWESSLEFSAPTVMWFLAQAGGAVEW